MATQKQILETIKYRPVEIGHWVGFHDLTDMHNEWLRMFLFSSEDLTLQAHRGSYKTTCLSLFLAIHTLIKPNENVMYFRKTDTDVKEVARQTTKLLQTGCFREMTQALYGVDLKLIRASNGEIETNLHRENFGASQIVGLGIGTSITGKHGDIVITDDIVNVNDRVSKAERERTKLAYQELQNIKNRWGREINTGTPWHEEDAFTLMPNIVKFDCYTTKLISEEKLADIKSKMLPSLFSANYELRHIASEDVIFDNPQTGGDPEMAKQGIYHVDCAYDGEDYTALTIANKHDGKLYVYGKCWRKNCIDLEDTILSLADSFNSGRMYNEKNADKGFFARDIRAKGGRVTLYNENMNKYVKITSYLKAVWNDVIFVQGTDEEYIKQITDYYEDAEHDDCPDSLASVARIYYKKTDDKYEPLWVM